jgi:FAD/FMN-containing dehydrogenase
LALDIPITDDSLFPFLRSMDELVLRHGGRVYLAKDSTLSPEHFRQMYPRYKEFQVIKNLVDPNHVFSSSMARRLKLVED